MRKKVKNHEWEVWIEITQGNGLNGPLYEEFYVIADTKRKAISLAKSNLLKRLKINVTADVLPSGDID